MDDLMTPFTVMEFDQLDKILSDVWMPEGTRDMSALHGFFMAIAIGPNLMLPNEWLPLIFGGQLDVFQIFKSVDVAQEGINFVLRFYNQVMKEWEEPDEFRPLLYAIHIYDREFYATDEWCLGFMRAVLHGEDMWASIFELPQDKELMALPVPFGTQEGMEFTRDLDEDVYRIAVVALGHCIVGIKQFWDARVRVPELFH